MDRSTYSNELWKYNINSNKWNKMNTTYNPPKCNQHRVITYKNYLILFGGFNKIDNKPVGSNDLYIYDCDNNIWNKIECINKPLARCFHGMCIVNKYLIIHAGQDINHKVLNDMYSIDINDIIINNSPKWIKVNNNIPPIVGHLMLGYKNRLYCFGGESKNWTYFRNNDLRIYNFMDFNTGTLHKISKIDKRCLHNGCIIHLNNHDYIFVFGGMCTPRYRYNDAFLICVQGNGINDYEIKSDSMEQKWNDITQSYEAKIKSMENEINELKTQLQTSTEICKDLVKFNDESTKQIKKYENEIKSLKQRRNENKSEQKNNNTLTQKEKSFKEYFLNEFSHIKSRVKYYNNLVSNEITSINTFILINNISDVNEYIQPINKIHGNLFLKTINQIIRDRNKFEEKLESINMFDYLDDFDRHGIFTLKQYNNKIKNINDLKKIINNNKACITIFNSINNEEQHGTGMLS